MLYHFRRTILFAVMFALAGIPANAAQDDAWTYDDLEEAVAGYCRAFAHASMESENWRDALEFAILAAELGSPEVPEEGATEGEPETGDEDEGEDEDEDEKEDGDILAVRQIIEFFGSDDGPEGADLLLLDLDDLALFAIDGDLDAAFELGYRYLHADGGNIADSKMGLDWMKAPALNDYPEAMFEMGRALRRNRIKKAMMAAWSTSGPTEAVRPSLGGGASVEFEFFNIAKQDGHEGAAAFVAISLIEQGRDLDDPDAKDLADEGWSTLRAASRRGEPWAEYMLARAFAEGFGLPLNKKLALEWAGKAASHGLRDAQELAGELGLATDGGQVRDADALELSWIYLYLAAARGSWTAQYQLGARLYLGEGIAPNAAARTWLAKAAQAGHMPASAMLRESSLEVEPPPAPLATPVSVPPAIAPVIPPVILQTAP